MRDSKGKPILWYAREKDKNRSEASDLFQLAQSLAERIFST
jgi:hypothetical protein